MVIFTIMISSLGMSAPAQAQVINITSSPTSFSTEGETITFTYELENLGSYYLTSIDTITPTNPDPGGGPGVTMGACESFPNGELAPNETVTCTGTYQITASNIMSGQLTHQISMDGQRIGGSWNVTSSNFTMQLVGGGPTSTSVESLTNPSELGEDATFRATVASFGCNAGLAPQGTVTFTVGSVTSSAIAVTPISPISGQGTAEFTTNSLPAGSYGVSAAFTPSGADNCGPSSGTASTNHIVNEPLPALPVVNNTNTVVDANSTDNPVTLDISGEDIQSVAVASGPSNGTATVSGTDIVYTPDSGFSGRDSFTYTATNAAGTSEAATATINVEAADPPPTVTFADVPEIVNSSFQVTFSFSEAVDNLTMGDLVVTNGLLNFLSYSGGVYSAHITPTADGAVTIDIPAGVTQDSAGNDNLAAQALTFYDGTAPVPLMMLSSDTQPRIIQVDVTFTESVIGLDASDFRITNGSLVSLSGSDFTYKLAVAPNGTGDVIIDLNSAAVQDAAGNDSARATLTVDAPVISISVSDLPVGKVNSEYETVSLSASGGTGPYAFDLSSGRLPDGITLSNDGKLTGTPTEDGNFSLTFRATDASGFTGIAESSLTVEPSRAVIVTWDVSGGGNVWAFTPTGANPGGEVTSPAVITDTSVHFDLDSDSGYVFEGASDNCGGHLSAGGSFWQLPNPLAIDCHVDFTFTPANAPTVSNTDTPVNAGSTDNPVILDIEGLDIESVAIASGPSNGVATISGTDITYTPNVGFFGTDSFTYTATNATGTSAPATATITVKAPDITLGPGSLPAGTGGAPYGPVTMTADGGSGDYTFSTTDTLPDGISLATDGTLSGSPTEDGSFTFTVTAKDENGFTGQHDFTLSIDTPEITLDPDGLPDAVAGKPYEALTFTAAGGNAPYGFTLDGTVPQGMSLEGGKLSGTPTEAGNFQFNLIAEDRDGFTGQRGYTLSVSAPDISLSPEALPEATAYAEYTQAFTVSGGKGPYSYQLTEGRLPDGMTFEDGTLSGTPLEAGDFPFSLMATDGNGFTIAGDYTLSVIVPGIALTPENLPDGLAGTEYAPVSFAAEGGKTPYSFELEGDLPEGMIFRNRALSGTPTEAGEFMFTVHATDQGDFTGQREYTLTIAAPDLALTPEALPEGRVNSAYSASLQAEGGTAPYAFTVARGQLPEGLSLAEDGTLSGTPLDPGSFEVTMTATDRYGFTGSRVYEIAIEDITLPQPRNHELTVMAGTSGTVDLTRGASGGPFIDAAIVANPADEAGTARIAREGGSHILHFSASGIYAGTTSLSYTLSNADGISDPASVTITVVARPDPSLDPEVIGLVRAQTETAKRFAKAQIRNFSQRLEQLHDEGTRRRNSIVLNLVAQSSRHDSDSLSLRGPERFGNQSSDLAFWSGGYVNFGSSDDDGIDLDHTLVGISAGADYRFTPKFTAGLGLGYGRDVTDIGNNGTESRARAISMAAYGSYRPKPGFFIDGLAGYSSLDFDSKRYVTSTGDMATGTRGGEQLFAALTAGYEHRRDGLLISPYGRLSGSRSTLDMFTEEGGGVYNLSYDEQVVETLSGTLGLRFEHSRPMDWGNLTSRARIEYTHEFENSSEARIGYADLGTFPYAIDVEGYSRDELAIGLGLDAQIGEFWTLGLDYRTAFGTDGDSRDQAVAVKLDVRF
ncbi:autotransporter domain-containing protein [Paracoccus saliphilus]|uniref:Autotransporter domain-containing protein n=1 Tax=Paracoccus saliphilus TaxID=405559 RepID=A0ABY7S630_9RHOB|nr:autotransporter domain-containing protein [Paracoccus saliphilus]